MPHDGGNLEDPIADGSIEALSMPRNRDSVRRAAAPIFRPLMKDWRTGETAYFGATGIIPIR